MRAECINNTNFKGNVVVLGKYSSKPQQCIDKVFPVLEELIKPKRWDLYLKQDFSAGKINMACEYVYPFKKSGGDIPMVDIPITAKSSKYIDAAKKAINDYKSMLEGQREKEQKKEETKEDIKEYFALMFLPIILTVGMMCEGIEYLKKDFNKIAKKLATKKG